MAQESREALGLGTGLWRTRGYLLRKFKHFVLFSALSGVGMLLELAVDLMDSTC